MVPLEIRNASTYVLAFDNTGGELVTGVALANPSSSVSVWAPMIIRDDTGAQILTTTRGFSPLTHTSFVLTYPETAGKRGTIEFDLSPEMQLSVLGLPFYVDEPVHDHSGVCQRGSGHRFDGASGVGRRLGFHNHLS